MGLYEKRIESLKSLLSIHNYLDLITIFAFEIALSDGNVLHSTSLNSPYREMIYTIGLIMTTSSNGSTPIKKENQNEIYDLLNKIEKSYRLILRKNENRCIKEGMSQEQTFIALMTHIDYFFTSSVTFINQDLDRLNELFSSYDTEISEKTGFSYSDVIGFFNQTLEIRTIKLNEYIKANGLKTNPQKKDLMRNQLFSDNINALKSIIEFSRDELKNDEYRKVCDFFSLSKSDGTFFHYTEKNPFESKPIIKTENNKYIIPLYKQLPIAIDMNLREMISDKDAFYKRRDKALENKLFIEFSLLGKDSCSVYQSVYEEPTSRYEHDLLIQHGKTLLIIEAKAKRIREPLRDPDRCYKRLKDDFASESGIQGAYNQAIHLKDKLLSLNNVPLYNKKGEFIVNIDRESYDEILIALITYDEWGFSSVNPSFLLEEINEEKPWICSITNLEAIFMSLNDSEDPILELLKYIKWKKEIQDKILSTDEIEPFGYYLKNKESVASSFDDLDFIIYSPLESDIVDEKYFEINGSNSESFYIT